LNIGVDPKQVERQRQLDLLQRVGDDSFPLAAHGAGLSSTSGDVGGAERPAKVPLLSLPVWLTKSTSTNPGIWSSHSAQVLIGIWGLQQRPGLGNDRPFNTSSARSSASRPSMLAPEMAISWAAV
jgi:hypothetical protein